MIRTLARKAGWTLQGVAAADAWSRFPPKRAYLRRTYRLACRLTDWSNRP